MMAICNVLPITKWRSVCTVCVGKVWWLAVGQMGKGARCEQGRCVCRKQREGVCLIFSMGVDMQV